jgi:KUP system potassium uptake protein
MSHFGRLPIATAWFTLVFPTLILNYLGQGAIVLADKTAFDNPFFAMAPGPWLIPMVILATVATVIASQALISGAFTLTEQAVNLNLWPRLRIIHTSSHEKGQVYVPGVNAVLAIACLTLVVTFRSSDHLAAAFGLAVSATMLATTIAFYHVVTTILHWKRLVVIPLVTLFAIVDTTFFLSGLPKLAEGAWLPLAISAVFVLTSWTWIEGRRCVSKSLLALQMPLEEYLKESHPTDEAPKGTMVFLTGNPHGVPFIGGKHRWIRARAEEERIVLLTLTRAARPYVPESERVTIEHLNDRLHVVQASFGYMEGPLIKKITAACGVHGLDIDGEDTSFFYADPKIVKSDELALPKWQRGYFDYLLRNSRPLPDDLEIPPERRVELGIEVAI